MLTGKAEHDGTDLLSGLSYSVDRAMRFQHRMKCRGAFGEIEAEGLSHCAN